MCITAQRLFKISFVHYRAVHQSCHFLVTFCVIVFEPVCWLAVPVVYSVSGVALLLLYRTRFYIHDRHDQSANRHKNNNTKRHTETAPLHKRQRVWWKGKEEMHLMQCSAILCLTKRVKEKKGVADWRIEFKSLFLNRSCFLNMLHCLRPNYMITCLHVSSQCRDCFAITAKPTTPYATCSKIDTTRTRVFRWPEHLTPTGICKCTKHILW